MHNVIPYSPLLALMESHVHIYKIYVLKDPFSNEVMYVGQTFQELDSRLKGHISDVGETNPEKVAYILSLNAQGIAPVIETVETIMGTCIIDKALAIEREGYWVKYYTALGIKLLNSTAKNHYNGRQYREYLNDLKTGTSRPEYYYCGKTYGGDSVYDMEKMKADGFYLVVDLPGNSMPEMDIDLGQCGGEWYSWVKPELLGLPMPSWSPEFMYFLPKDKYFFDLEVDESDYELEYYDEQDDHGEDEDGPEIDY